MNVIIPVGPAEPQPGSPNAEAAREKRNVETASRLLRTVRLYKSARRDFSEGKITADVFDQIVGLFGWSDSVEEGQFPIVNSGEHSLAAEAALHTLEQWAASKGGTL